MLQCWGGGSCHAGPLGTALPRPGCGGGGTSLIASLLAPGRIIYFSNRGGRSRERPACARSASKQRGGARRSAERRRALGHWVPRPRAGGAMLAVSFKWRLGVVRRRPKGTGPRGLGVALGPAGGRRPRGPLPAPSPRAPPSSRFWGLRPGVRALPWPAPRVSTSPCLCLSLQLRLFGVLSASVSFGVSRCRSWSGSASSLRLSDPPRVSVRCLLLCPRVSGFSPGLPVTVRLA